jgi:hypothetical protein
MSVSQVIKVLKIIIGIFLLLISVFGGLTLLSSEFVQVTEYPPIVFTTYVFRWLITFAVSAAVAAFFAPRCFQLYLLLIIAFSAFFQIGCFFWTPLLMAILCTLVLTAMRSLWLRWAWLLPALSFVFLTVDAFVLHHRIAVLAHSLHSIVAFDYDPKIMRSPSGKTTAYLVSGGFQDVFYTVCISNNHLMPIAHIIDPSGIDGSTSTDMIARWDGPVFLAGDKLVSFAYDERSGKAIDMASYTQGGIQIGNEAFMKHIKTSEAFAEYLLSLPPKR